MNGNISATYFAYPRDVWAATRQGLTELGMPLNQGILRRHQGVKVELASIIATATKSSSLPLNAYRLLGRSTGVHATEYSHPPVSVIVKAANCIFQQIGNHVPAHMLPQSSGPGTFAGGAPLVSVPVGTGAVLSTATNTTSIRRR